MPFAQSLQKKKTQASIVYFADTAWFPYNDKSKEEITSRTIHACETLLQHSCSVIILACNTAAAVAYNTLINKFLDKVKIYNIVDLTVNSLMESPQKKQNIGVIGTVHTINSEIYKKNIESLSPHLLVKQLATPKLAPLSEIYYTDRSTSINPLYEYLNSAQLKEIDTLILACTHYSIFKNEIQAFYNGKVNVIDAVDMTNSVITNFFDAKPNSNNSIPEKPLILYSKNVENFSNASKLFLGNDIILKEI